VVGFLLALGLSADDNEPSQQAGNDPTESERQKSPAPASAPVPRGWCCA